ncbi:PstS family phosphate ABC transporter substrate-binding protein [Geminisphaera colitermitum]|uniref:PstS family phosphate ABC transporter substrate-binding protein n=1 Tax=Geminisphaera colitermitum TaxID=1148786 RepID=UPI000158CBF1|nr:substrate-binding domain-containing protein [Geminisphaera colitermitum]
MPKNTRAPRSLLVATIVSLFFLPAFLSAQIRIVGSDMLGGGITSELARFAKRNDLDIRVNLKGSEPALHSLKRNEADLAVIIVGPRLSDVDADYIVRPAAYQAAIIVVRDAVTLTEITFDQLSGIYNEGATSNFRRWADLNVRAGSWSQRTIQPIALDPRNSLSFELVRSVAFAGVRTLKPSVTLTETPAAALARIKAEESAIAILPLPPPAGSGLKTLLVSPRRGETAYQPTPENLHAGTYPFRLRVQFVFRKDNAARLRSVLRELLSEDAEKMWKAAGFTPLPAAARNELVFELENL